MIDVGKGGAGGGMQNKPMPEAPTAWLPYVRVDDVKKTGAKARKLGVTIQADYVDIGAMGTIGVFTDPQEQRLASGPCPQSPIPRARKRGCGIRIGRQAFTKTSGVARPCASS
jgi:hypothetical protein